MEATTVPGKLTLHPAWILFAALALAVPMGAFLMRAPMRAELPVLANLPQFRLVDQDNRPFSRDAQISTQPGWARVAIPWRIAFSTKG